MLRAEQENLLAAHAWCAHAPQGGALAQRLVASLSRYWRAVSQPETGYRLAQAAIDLAAGEPDDDVRCAALSAAAGFALGLGRYDATLSYGERALAIGRRLGAAGPIAEALNILGAGLHATGDLTRAMACYREAADLAEDASDRSRLSAALNGIGEIQRDLGNLADAELHYRRAIDVDRAEGNLGCSILNNLARACIGMGRLDDARAALEEFLARSGTGRTSDLHCSLDVAVALAAASACHPVAARLRGASLALERETGLRHEPVDERLTTALLMQSRAALGEAAYDAAVAEGMKLGPDAAAAEALRWLREGPSASPPPAPRGARRAQGEARHPNHA